MSNGTPPTYLHNLIDEIHAARQAGDTAQMQAASVELQRVMDEANQPDLEAAQGDTFGDRLAGGITGAAKGVGDLATGAVQTAKAIANPHRYQPGELSKHPMEWPGIQLLTAPFRAPGKIREATQQFRAGASSPEDLARAWTGGSAQVIGPILMALQASGLDQSPSASLTSPFRAAGQAAVQGLKNVEDVVSPRTALYRMRLHDARASAAAKASAAVPEAEGTAGATAEELAVAKQLGLPIEQVRGRTGESAFAARRTAPTPISEGAPGSGKPDMAPRPAYPGQVGGLTDQPREGISVEGPPTPPAPTTPTVTEILERKPMAATAETMARVQRGATKGQLAYRASRFGKTAKTAGGGLSGAPLADLEQGLQANAPGSVLYQVIVNEVLRRGLQLQ